MTPISLEDSGMFKHRDILDELNKNLSLEQKVGMLLTQLRARFPTIERIALLYVKEGEPLAVEIDESFMAREAYREGSFTDPPDLSIYE